MATRRPTARDRASVFKALADPHRVAIVDALAEHGSMCGTELSERLGVSLALLCHHWDVLLDAGLVKKQRVGQLRMCTLDEGRLQEALQPYQLVGAAKPNKAPKTRVEARGSSAREQRIEVEAVIAPTKEAPRRASKPPPKRAPKRTRRARG